MSLGLVWGCASLPPAASAPRREDAGQAGTPQRSAEVMALVAEAQTRLTSGEVEEGVKMLRQAAAMEPASGELQEELGLALANASMFDEAARVLRKVSELSTAGEAVLGILLTETAQTPADLE
ncbi:MAG TPA: hypothetical protein VED41_07045, partial [Solirubrobacteraceae bacterium]|nr:hypothetical protein [Solirubrobacteraceae bacterium]